MLGLVWFLWSKDGCQAAACVFLLVLMVGVGPRSLIDKFNYTVLVATHKNLHKDTAIEVSFLSHFLYLST